MGTEEPNFDRKTLLAIKEFAEEGCYLGLGYVITSFQALEQELTEIAGIFLDSEDYQLGVIVTSELSFRGLVGLVYSLAQHRGVADEEVEELREILKQCSSSEQRRNALIHSYWDTDPGTLHVTRYKYTAKYPKGYRHQVEKLASKDLLEFASDIRGLCGALVDFMDDNCPGWAERTPRPEPVDVTSSLLPPMLRADLDGTDSLAEQGADDQAPPAVVD